MQRQRFPDSASRISSSLGLGVRCSSAAVATTGAVQCGFCTPGLIVATMDLLRRVPEPTDDQIREALSGNLCRCTGYAKIFDAVRLAAGS